MQALFLAVSAVGILMVVIPLVRWRELNGYADEQKAEQRAKEAVEERRFQRAIVVDAGVEPELEIVFDANTELGAMWAGRHEAERFVAELASETPAQMLGRLNLLR